MFRHEQESKLEYRENMRGGDGTVTIRHLFTKEELGLNSRLIARITLPPGASIGSHEHTGEREIYHVIQGKASFEENGETYLMGPGDSSITGDGASHSIRNVGQEALEFLAVIIMD